MAPDSERHERVEHLERLLGMVAPDFTLLSAAKTDRRTLVIAKEVIAKLAFNDVYAHSAWKDCSLRRWLNTEYLSGLPENMRSAIVPSDGDMVFAPSIGEVQAYFKGDAERMATYQGKPAWWWLRDTGIAGHAAFVSKDGFVNAHGYRVDNCFGGGVRPALWLDMRCVGL